MTKDELKRFATDIAGEARDNGMDHEHVKTGLAELLAALNRLPDEPRACTCKFESTPMEMHVTTDPACPEHGSGFDDLNFAEAEDYPSDQHGQNPE